MVYILHSNKQNWRHARVRISNGRYLNAIPVDVAASELRDDDKLEGSGIDILGKGISSLYGKGIGIVGNGQGPLVEQYKTDPLYQSYGHLVVLPDMLHGNGVGAVLKKGLNRLVSFGKKKAFPRLLNVGKRIGREALQSGKRVALDALDDIGPALVDAGVDAVGKKLGNNIAGDVAKASLRNLGNRANKGIRSRVESQGKLSNTEGQISEAVANRSRALLAQMMKKNEQNSKRGNGIEEGVFKNNHFYD